MASVLTDRNGILGFRFQKGNNILDEVTTDRLNAMLDSINSAQLTTVVNGYFRKTLKGTAIIIDPSVIQSATPFPWKVSIRPNPDDPSGQTFQASVNLNSSLFLSNKPDDNFTITGLDSWFDFDPGNDLIWLYVIVDEFGNPTGATIQSYGQGDSGFDPTEFEWPEDQNGYMNSAGGSPDYQINFNVPLHYSTFDTDGNVVNVQMADKNLILYRDIDAGISFVYARPDYRTAGYEKTDDTVNSFNAQALYDHPFKVYIRRVDVGTYQAKVSINSDVIKSRKMSDNLSISGLDTWFSFDPGDDLIWIYIVISSYVATSATIQSYGQGNGGFDPTLAAWDDDGGYVQDDGGSPPKQIALNIPIFQSRFNGGVVENLQKCFTHVLLKTTCVDFQSAVVGEASLYGRYEA